MEKTLVHSRRMLFRLFAFLFALSFLFIFSSVSAEDEETAMPDNGIPVVYIDVDESQGTIEDMLESPDHSVYCYGTISIKVPEGFHYSDFPDLECVSLDNLPMSIRGRGNSTWQRASKKPFKIKLDKKTDVFSLGKNKHWALIANEFDTSLLRDRITAWLGDVMGFEFTPRGVPVDLVMTGDEFGTRYLGSYYFTENVRVDDNRLEIDELTEDDVDEPAITGGYLLQDSLQTRMGSPDIFFTKRGVDWATHTPSFDTEEEGNLGDNDEAFIGGTLLEESFAYPDLGDAYENHVQQTYIQNHIQKVEDALYSESTEYREFMDVESAAKYWLVNTFSLNADAYITGSTYIYKKRDAGGTVGKVYWGPLWDFDYAWDNRDYTKGFPVRHEWLKALFCDRGDGGFVEEVKKQWVPLRSAVVQLIEEGGIIDQYAAETEASAYMDYPLNHGDDSPENFDYMQRVEGLKNWIRERLDWVDENIGALDTLCHKVRLIVDGETYELTFKEHGEYIEDIDSMAMPPAKEGYFFTGWADAEGNIVNTMIQINDDTDFTATFIPEDEAIHATDITFRKDSNVLVNNVHVSRYAIDYEIIPVNAHDKEVTWTSSDEEYATVDEFGIISFNGPGEVTITATLNSGKTRQFRLVVIEGEIPVPESISPETEEIHLEEGEYAPFVITTDPDPARIWEYQYSSDDESVVMVDSYGVLQAAGSGETLVHVRTVSYDSEGSEVINETSVKVIVGETESEPVPTPEPEEIVYKVVSGGNTSWTKADGKAVVITVKRTPDDDTCFSHFKSVQIDGADLKKNQGYTAKAGSTVVTIKTSALNSLKAGEHTVTILFDDGKAETVLIVSAADQKTSPDTSDHTGHAWLYVFGSALLAFVLTLRYRIQNR